jgi:hypothetical protein
MLEKNAVRGTIVRHMALAEGSENFPNDRGAHRIIFHNEKIRSFTLLRLPSTHVDGWAARMETVLLSDETLRMTDEEQAPRRRNPGLLSSRACCISGEK